MEYFGAESPTTNEPNHEADHHSSTLRIRNAISSLSFFERETLILAEYEGLELDQIAAVVDTDENTVGARLESARKRLRVALADLI
jgi:RNA polymerase sigma factor (sigma-70 family)